MDPVCLTPDLASNVCSKVRTVSTGDLLVGAARSHLPSGVPGPELARALDALTELATADRGVAEANLKDPAAKARVKDPAAEGPTVTDAELVELVASWERVSSWVTARQLDAVEELHARLRSVTPVGPDIPDAGEVAASELAARCRWSGYSAESRVSLAWTMSHRLPLTAAALREGRIDLARARILVDRTCHLDEAMAQLVEQTLVGRAERLSPSGLRRAVDRAVVEVDPSAVVRRRKRAQADRGVFQRPLPDGMAEVCVVTSAESATVCLDRLSKVARTRFGPRDPRSADQRRADAAVALLLGGLPIPGPQPGDGASADDRASADDPAQDGEFAGSVAAGGDAPASVLLPAGVPVQVNVTVPLSVLLGVDESAGLLDGYGPIAAGLARALATCEDASWRRLVTDPLTGTLLDVGRSSYRPPRDLDRFVRHRDGTCRFPGCGRSARLADLDHTLRFPDGPTVASNLTALCRRHHRFKHLAGWDVRAGPGADAGTQTIWTSPTGQVYVTGPDPLDPGADPGTSAYRHGVLRRRHGPSSVESHVRAVTRV